MKFALALLLCLSTEAFAHDFGIEFSETVLKIDRGQNTVIEAKSELTQKAQESCRIREILGTVTQISDFKVTHIAEQDRSADPRCHWRQSCYLPAMVSVSATFVCEF